MRSRRGPNLLLWGVAAALAGVVAFWYFYPQERPQWVTTTLPVAPSAKVALYRWKDESGQWIVSDRKPPDGVEFEQVEYRNDANVLPAPDDG